MEFLIEGTGTLGDVVPLLALAAELARRGHHCRLLTHDAYAERAAQAGVPFLSSSSAPLKVGERAIIEERVFPAFPALSALLDELRDKPSTSTVVVNCDRFATSNLIAERCAFAVARVHLSPFKLRPYEYRGEAAYELFARDPRLLRAVNQRRRDFGLAEVDRVTYAEHRVAAHVATFPSWFCEPKAGWPPNLRCIGFPLPREAAPLSPAAQAFLARHARPIVFTPGTGYDDVDAFFAAALACARELELPALALSRHGGWGWSRSDTLRLDFEPLGHLLPKSALIVHHGGIGTVARALQAGIPQIISPLGFDQPDNAAHVLALGAGLTVARPLLTGTSLARSIRELLADVRSSERLEALRARVQNQAEAVRQWAHILVDRDTGV